MSANEAIQEALRTEFEGLKRKNRSFSLRAYARRLGINSGVLSSILQGNRQVSPRYAERLLARMALPPEKLDPIARLLKSKKLRPRGATPARHVLQLRSDEFHLISHGIHYAILCLVELADFTPEYALMAKRLNESENKVRAASERLIRLGLIVIDGNNWRLTGAQLTTTDGVRDVAIQRFHEERLEEARQKLFTVPVEQRYFFSTTMAVQAANIPAAQHLITEFKRKMEDLLEQNPKTEVYRLCIQLFPVTNLQEGLK